jgi:hypothetical protein
MNWGRGGQKEEVERKEAERGRFAAPPPCPRCDLTKSQVGCVLLWDFVLLSVAV